LKKNERIKTIINLLKFKNAVSIRELTKQLGVSEMTVRRDLALLENDSIVELIPGGAIFRTYADSEREQEKYLIANEETRRTREKIRIGRKAASLIETNDTIILDVGSTTEYVAKFLREDLPVTVLCYALNILVEIYRKKQCSPIFAGGYFHDNTLMFESPDISAAGFHNSLGVTCANPYEIETKKAVLSSSRTKILLIDSTKFGKTKIAYFAEALDFDMIITDSEIPDEYRESIENLGIELVIV